MDALTFETRWAPRRGAAVLACVILVLLPLLACRAHGSVEEHGANATPTVIRLQAYEANLRLVQVMIAGKQRAFLFDTGGGMSFLGPDTAKDIQCQPYSQVSGYRMHGERVDFARCQPVTVGIGGSAIRITEVGMFDVNTLLPPEWPKVAGVIGLNAFDGRTITLDLGANILVLESGSSSQTRTSNLQTVPLKIRREIEGGALDVFLPIQTAKGPIWMLLDSSNVSGSVIDRKAAEALGNISKEKKPQPVVLRIVGGDEFTENIRVDDLVIEGNLGERWMSRHALTMDFIGQRIWIGTTKGPSHSAE